MGACIAYSIAHRPPFFLSASHQTTATSRVSSGSSTRKKARHQPTDARVDVSSHINNAPGLITPLSLSMHRNSCSNTLWTSRPDCADQCTRARTSTAHGPPLSHPTTHTPLPVSPWEHTGDACDACSALWVAVCSVATAQPVFRGAPPLLPKHDVVYAVCR